jgi:hypothetical protein
VVLKALIRGIQMHKISLELFFVSYHPFIKLQYSEELRQASEELTTRLASLIAKGLEIALTSLRLP